MINPNRHVSTSSTHPYKFNKITSEHYSIIRLLTISSGLAADTAGHGGDGNLDDSVDLPPIGEAPTTRSGNLALPSGPGVKRGAREIREFENPEELENAAESGGYACSGGYTGAGGKKKKRSGPTKFYKISYNLADTQAGGGAGESDGESEGEYGEYGNSNHYGDNNCRENYSKNYGDQKYSKANSSSKQGYDANNRSKQSYSNSKNGTAIEAYREEYGMQNDDVNDNVNNIIDEGLADLGTRSTTAKMPSSVLDPTSTTSSPDDSSPMNGVHRDGMHRAGVKGKTSSSSSRNNQKRGNHNQHDLPLSDVMGTEEERERDLFVGRPV
jgi:hypothetical protein